MKYILNAGVENTPSISGTHFRVTESSAPLKVSFYGGKQNQTVTLDRGMSFEPIGGFTSVAMLSDVNQEVYIEATSGAIDDNRIAGRVSVVIEALAGIATDRKPINALVTLIAQPNAGRNRLQIKNIGTENAYIGGLDADSKGYELKPGEDFEIKRAGGAELYAVSTVTGTTLHLFSEMDTAQPVNIPNNLLTTESGASLLTESGEYLTA